MSAICHNSPCLSARTSKNPGTSLRQRFVHLLDVVAAWGERARQRRSLASLGSDTLKDVGLSEADVYLETHKPFWQE